MDQRNFLSGRLISPPAHSSFSRVDDGSEGVSNRYLYPMNVGSLPFEGSGMSGNHASDADMEDDEGAEDQNGSAGEEYGETDLTSRTLLDSAERVLVAEGGKLHVREIQEKMVEYGLVSPSAKALANLESILYKETFRDNAKFKRIEGHFGWFALIDADVEDMDSAGSSSGEENSEEVETPRARNLKSRLLKQPQHDYKKKYYTLKRIAKQLIFENGCLCDDVSQTEEKLTRAKAERKFLLKRLFQYQAATEAGVLHPQGMGGALPQELSSLLINPSATANKPKNSKLKAKKPPQKAKGEKTTKVGAKNLKSGKQTKEKQVKGEKTKVARVSKASAQAKAMSKVLTQLKSTPPVKDVITPLTPAAEGRVTAPPKPTPPPKPAPSLKTTIPLTDVPPLTSKEKKHEKTKTAKPSKAKKPKKSESPQRSPANTGIESASGSGETGTKPKRKKPGTAIKRKVQPIPVDAKGKPIFPIVLGGLTVHSLGEIIWDRPGFHSERYIWPVGYCSSRTYPSIKDPDKKCIYTCKILDGGFGPQFEMCPEDDMEHPIMASSATACHCVVLKTLNKARGRDASNTGSGPEFFGFSHPTIQYLIQNLPGARKCSKYQWVKFELPKAQNKQGGKVVTAGSSEDVAARSLPPDLLLPPYKLSSSDQEGIGDSGMLTEDDSNMTFHSGVDDDEIFEDIDIQSSLRPLTLSNTGPTLSSSRLPSPLSPSPTSHLGGMDTSAMDISAMGPLMSSPTRPHAFSSSLSMTLSPPNMTSPPSTVTGHGSFIIPPTSPLFGSGSEFHDAGLADLPK
ncbi:uncharacterized protein LOC5511631 isoform X2 [Nematostella vectensis]|uniref:uncharacterized protein LOC5511631 isoform X2 n=1 Tax=Nematostella vectensis TaxID=45351 RepID=UPI00138FE32D|nr:uncharacterized protein LOC5511631 isoform X2 [Nematostella vectensis]